MRWVWGEVLHDRIVNTAEVWGRGGGGGGEGGGLLVVEVWLVERPRCGGGAEQVCFGRCGWCG